MTDIITLLYILMCIYSANLSIPDPNLAYKVFAEYQTTGAEAAIGDLGNYLPAESIQAGPASPGTITGETITEESTSEETATEETTSEESAAAATAEETPPAAVIDPAKLDYKEELKNLGFYKDDSKDTALNLRNAVLRFQSSRNMKVNGIWDKNCLKALVKALSAENTGCEDLIASPPSEGMWISINKTRRILTLYEGMDILKKYPIAIGNPASLTPEGKFTIVSKVINPYWGGGGYAKPVKGGLPSNPLGHRWMGLSYKTGDDLGIHGNNSPYSIGKNISHGCIRMINSDVEELFEIAPKSAHVWIGSDTSLKTWGIEQREITASVSVDQQQNQSP